MEDKKTKLPMYYQQIYNLMEELNKAYARRLGQIFFRVFRQFYARVRFDLSKEQRAYFEKKFKDLEHFETVEKTEFRGFSIDFERNQIAEKSDALLSPVYDLQLKLYEILEDSSIFNYLKENMNDLEVK